jgi:hypothetical protein
MELLTQLLHALWAQDFETLANPSMIGMLYFVLFMILFLENGLLPAAFLPGDSLLVLGRRAVRQRGDGIPANHFVTDRGASLGCWVSYIRDDGWAIRGSCKTGFRICLRIITSGRTTFSISTGFPRC